MTVQPDVENYLFMQQQSRREQSNSFLDKNMYFISADHAYIDWTREKNPGTIPSFVLPSVWYSIMLRFSGRATDDDYTAFCLFLNRRKSIAPETREIMKKRQATLQAVLSSDEPVDVKEEILFEVSDRLRSTQADIANIPEIVEESRSKILERRVNSVKEEHRLEKGQLQEDFKRELTDRATASFEEGKAHGKQENLAWFAKEKAKRNRRIKAFFSLLSILVVVLMAVILIAQFYRKEGPVWEFLQFFNENTVVLSIIAGTYALIAILAGIAVKNTNFLSCDENVIIEKMKSQMHKSEGSK